MLPTSSTSMQSSRRVAAADGLMTSNSIRSVPETQVLYSSQKLALFKYSNNPYKLPDGSDAASAAAAELITSDSRYLFISKQSDTGRLKLQSQFLNPAFLQVAIEITRDSSVSKICNFRELSKRPEYSRDYETPLGAYCLAKNRKFQ
ncbi:hypothetical protein BDR26DRAFT_934622 [Obelidium mucronatum]|nr:hypothetical protein BDR26DRAFT_934622 [Obelidium mucronatum]